MKSILARPIAWVRHPAVWIPAVALAAVTVMFWQTDLDQILVRRYFSASAPGSEVLVRFPLAAHQPWRWLYEWGVYPAWILGGFGLVVWIASFIWTKLEDWRDPGLFCALVLLIGPGILVNCVFKPFWDRPRPNAIRSFGGSEAFVPLWQLGSGTGDHSFPSGHAAAGFYLMTPAFVFYRRRPWTALAFLLLGLASGTLIGLARMVAGGHFPSDVLWAGGIVYFTALALAVPFHFDREKS